MNIRKYSFDETSVLYLIDEQKHVNLLLVPKNRCDEVYNAWDRQSEGINPRATYNARWELGSIVHFYTTDFALERPAVTMKSGIVDTSLTLEEHEMIRESDGYAIISVLKSDKGYKIIHTLKYIDGLKGFEVETKFVNESEKECVLQMLSSFSLDNLSPFQKDDAPNKYFLHRFYGGWSLEGKHIRTPIEDLALEKSWAGYNAEVEKFGSIGSYPVGRYFPTAVFEDYDANIFWGCQIAHNSTWQMELRREFDTMSLMGGIGDNDYCGWEKHIKPGESFEAPKAYVSVSDKSFEDACSKLVDMHKPSWEKYGEKGLPVVFNEYCTTWGKPTQKKMLELCSVLKNFGVKYAVIDAGWSKAGSEQDSNGEWCVDKSIFPDMKEMNRKIKEMGLIPGIWFEFEVTTKGSIMFESEYDYMHLTRYGNVIKNNDFRSYWDFRREDVKKYLREKVIHFLKEYQFGYIKVDYNCNIGKGVDGDDSASEALRIHLAAVKDFFVEMKREIPDLIIENCASGGHRLEPSMIGISAVSSFSDAHEAVEIPYIAANLHRLMLPAQSLIWCVLHNDESIERTIYSLAAAFLGRICLSGQVDELRTEQYVALNRALDFYRKTENVIKNGVTHIYGNRGRNTRYPTGTQVVVRSTNEQIVVVCHAFENPCERLGIEIPEGYVITDSFYSTNIVVSNGKIIINKLKPFTAEAVLLELE